jgi:hypothetical protein
MRWVEFYNGNRVSRPREVGQLGRVLIISFLLSSILLSVTVFGSGCSGTAPTVAANWTDTNCANIGATASNLNAENSYYVTYTDPDGVVQGTSSTHSGTSKFTDYFVLDITLPTILGNWTVKLYETPDTLKDTDTVNIGKMIWATDSTYTVMKNSFVQGETVYFKAIGLSASKDYKFRLSDGSAIYDDENWTTGVTTLTGSYTLSTSATPGTWDLAIQEKDDSGRCQACCGEIGRGEACYAGRSFTVTPSPGNNVSITITSSPAGSGFVNVDDAAITTPQIFNWTVGSTHTLEALSPVAGTQYVWTSWSDGGNQTHDYIVPSASENVTANYETQYLGSETQYLVSFKQTGSGVAPTVTYTTGATDTTKNVPCSVLVNPGTEITYTYENNVSGDNGVYYVLLWPDYNSSQTVNENLTITATYIENIKNTQNDNELSGENNEETESAATYTPPPENVAPIPPPILTATFVLQNLIINPTQAKVGDVVRISVSVMNTGSAEGTYTAELRINGVLTGTQTVTLQAGWSHMVTFYFTPESDGTYSVEIGGLTGSLSVVTPLTVVPLSSSLIFLIAVIIIGAPMGAILVRRRYFGRKRM